MQVVKTIRVPVHHGLTKRKLRILGRLTARLTYGVYVWSKLIEQNRLSGTYSERDRLSRKVQYETELPAAMVQCCFDTANWMWNSYRHLRRDWSIKVDQAQRDGDAKWLSKLLEREPQKPFSKGMRRKIPIWFDERIGSIEASESMKLTPLVARISTLKKRKKLTIPLNPAKYHLGLLSKAELKSFQLLERKKHYYVHVKAQFSVPTQPVNAVRGIDLGVKRSVSTVLLHPNLNLHASDFQILRDGDKRLRLNYLNRRVAELQYAEKWEPLKRMRTKRRRIAAYFDRLTAKQVADISANCLVAVGYPKGLKYRSYSGNGKPRLRRLITGWAYGRAVRFIREKCAERGILAEFADERWTSKTCPRCRSRDTERPRQSLLHCWNCELWYNADYAGAINIGSRFLPMAATQMGAADSPDTGDEQVREIVTCEPRNPRMYSCE